MPDDSLPSAGPSLGASVLRRRPGGRYRSPPRRRRHAAGCGYRHCQPAAGAISRAAGDPGSDPGRPQADAGLLGISEIRRGVEGRNQQSPNFANYDESKVAPYPPLPELMVTKAGKRVTTPKAWWDVRRPELVELFDREVYGRTPKVTPQVSWSVTNTSEETVGGVTLVKKELLGTVDNSGHPAIEVKIEAAVWTPRDARDRCRSCSSSVPAAARSRRAVRRPPGRPGKNRSWPRAGATPASFPRAFRPTTAPG